MRHWQLDLDIRGELVWAPCNNPRQGRKDSRGVVNNNGIGVGSFCPSLVGPVKRAGGEILRHQKKRRNTFQIQLPAEMLRNW